MIKKLAVEEIQNKLKDGLKECSLPPVVFHIIKHTLNNLGYYLSDNEFEMDEMIELNGWECDYYLYIWKMENILDMHFKEVIIMVIIK